MLSSDNETCVMRAQMKVTKENSNQNAVKNVSRSIDWEFVFESKSMKEKKKNADIIRNLKIISYQLSNTETVAHFNAQKNREFFCVRFASGQTRILENTSLRLYLSVGN